MAVSHKLSGSSFTAWPIFSSRMAENALSTMSLAYFCCMEVIRNYISGRKNRPKTLYLHPCIEMADLGELALSPRYYSLLLWLSVPLPAVVQRAVQMYLRSSWSNSIVLLSERWFIYRRKSRSMARPLVYSTSAREDTTATSCAKRHTY
eukprot:gb/GECG01006964.1/.p1 GENE.gb/GECG01006964.1/~~gb/GECG01006964.1/.p1  ORF type:complete len:149 (+),score=3.98 gb/GECG01006964.1/:1-447(+)